ncbi:MAG: LacI family transcriptional regulator [Clostridiales bacterium]|jgi:DNA-binding LacI/PurR family transcriptional regulator|nr:LacI family transcriptional regulator [Clostridiales bacterium]
MSVTIREVAKEAGTSISTVSKALNNSYTISGETTEHVKAVAERLGYRPNARAQTFARQASREVVFLTYLPKDIAFTNPHMFEILAGAEAALRLKGYAIKLRGCDADTVCDLTKDISAGKLADGLLLHASVVTRELAVLINRLEIPHIVIGKPGFPSSLCWIDNNNQLAGEIAAGYLLDLGHRRIAFIGGLDGDRISQDRLEGVLNRLEEQRIKPDGSHILKADSTIQNGSDMAKTLTDGYLPDAIVCANNLLACGCLRLLQRRGINVPDDLSLITFDDYPLAQWTAPMLTTVSIDMYEMGMSAGKLLVNKIKKPEMQVQTYTTLPRLIERESAAAPKKVTLI